MVKNYFFDVFSNHRSCNINSEVEEVRCVTARQNEELITELTYEEFTKAAKKMHPEKSAGPDGLNPTFFSTILASSWA